MKFGVIGLGNHSVNRVMPAIQKSGNVISSILTRREDKGKSLAERFQCSYQVDQEAFFREDFEAVYIASPNSLHFAQASLSLEHGRHVLLEKPMTLSSGDSNRLCRMADGDNLKLSVGFHMRFHPGLQTLRSILGREEIGNITMISGSWAGLGGSSHEDPDRNWWTVPEMAGGGSVMGTGVHVIDALNYIMGRAPEYVSAFRIPEGSVVDKTSHIMMRYGEIVATAFSSRLVESPDNSLYIFGDEGTIEASGIFGTEIRGKIVSSGRTLRTFRGGSPYVREIEGFVSHVSGKETEIATGEDGHRVVKIVEASIRSSSGGSTMKIS